MKFLKRRREYLYFRLFITLVVGDRTSSWKNETQKFCSARHTGSSCAKTRSKTSSKRLRSAALAASVPHWSLSTPSSNVSVPPAAPPATPLTTLAAPCFNFPARSSRDPLPLPERQKIH